jgi:hypothetical protein
MMVHDRMPNPAGFAYRDTTTEPAPARSQIQWGRGLKAHQGPHAAELHDFWLKDRLLVRRKREGEEVIMSGFKKFEESLRFTRTSDKKVFKVTFYSHWSTIQADDGETDAVKWFGGDDYVSASQGHTYTKSSVSETEKKS